MASSGARHSRIAQVYLQYLPSFDGFFTETEREMRRKLPQIMQDAMDNASSSVGSNIASNVTNAINSGVQNAASGSNQHAAQQLGNTVGNTAGQAAGTSMGKKVMGALAAVGIGKFLADQIGSAVEAQNINAKVNAAANLTAAQSAVVAKASNNVYTSAYGESREQIAETMQSILTTVTGAKDKSQKELEQMAKDTLDITSVFGLDSAQVTAAASQLMTKGLVKNWDEAVDVITGGYTQMGEKGEDWADTIKEYAGDIKNLGLTGQQFASITSEMVTKGGFFNTDTAADFLREFQIQARSGENAKIIESLGLDPAAMQKAANEGGQALIGSFSQLMTALQKQGNKSLYGEIFGTQAEDQLSAVMDTDWSKLGGDIDSVTGSMSKLDTQLNDTAASALESFKRSIESAFMEALYPALELVTPLLTSFVSFLQQNQVAAQIIGVLIGVVLVGAVVALTGALWAMIVPILANPATYIILGIVVAVGLLIAGIVLLSQHWAEVTKWMGDTWTGFTDKVGGAAEWVANTWNDGFAAVVNWINGAVNTGIDGINKLKEALNSIKFTAPSWLGGWTFKGFDLAMTSHVPNLASGATIMPSRGGTMVNVAEAGRPESVVDTGLLNKQLELSNQNLASADSNVTYNIYQQPGESTEELVRRIDDFKTFNRMD